jgi:Tubulin-tyrosine ligase family
MSGYSVYVYREGVMRTCSVPFRYCVLLLLLLLYYITAACSKCHDSTVCSKQLSAALSYYITVAGACAVAA